MESYRRGVILTFLEGNTATDSAPVGGPISEHLATVCGYMNLVVKEDQRSWRSFFLNVII